MNIESSVVTGVLVVFMTAAPGGCLPTSEKCIADCESASSTSGTTTEGSGSTGAESIACVPGAVEMSAACFDGTHDPGEGPCFLAPQVVPVAGGYESFRVASLGSGDRDAVVITDTDGRLGVFPGVPSGVGAPIYSALPDGEGEAFLVGSGPLDLDPGDELLLFRGMSVIVASTDAGGEVTDTTVLVDGIQPGMFPQVVDRDGDGHNDVVLGVHSSEDVEEIRSYLWTPEGFTMVPEFQVTPNTHHVVLDLDGILPPDFISADWGPQPLEAHTLRPGTESFFSIPLPQGEIATAVGAYLPLGIGTSGRDDIVRLAEGGKALLFGNDSLVDEEPAFHAEVLETCERAATLGVGDVDGDGDEDLIVAAWSPDGPGLVTFHLNDGAGGFEPGPTLEGPSEPVVVLTATLTTPGLLDVVIFDSGSEAFWIARVAP